jgi:hypothetical protein
MVWIGQIRNGMVRYANDIVRIEPVQNGMVCYGTQWYSTVRTGVERNGMVWYEMVGYAMEWYGT